MDDEDLGRSGEVVELFESKVVNFNRVLFQVQDYGAYTLWINDIPNAIDLRIIHFSQGFVLGVDLKVGIDGVSAS